MGFFNFGSILALVSFAIYFSLVVARPHHASRQDHHHHHHHHPHYHHSHHHDKFMSPTVEHTHSMVVTTKTAFAETTMIIPKHSSHVVHPPVIPPARSPSEPPPAPSSTPSSAPPSAPPAKSRSPHPEVHPVVPPAPPMAAASPHKPHKSLSANSAAPSSSSSPSTKYPPLSYSLVKSYSGGSFFDQFNFFTGDDPTHGFVEYIKSQES